MYALIWINQEVVIECYGCPLLVRVSLKYIVINILLADICSILLLLLLFCIFWQSDILAVSNLILSIVRLEIMEHIFTKLKINIQWDLMRVARIHFAQLIVDVKILVWKQSHINHGKVSLPPLLFVDLFFASSLSSDVVVSIDHLDPSSHISINSLSLGSSRDGSTTEHPLKNI